MSCDSRSSRGGERGARGGFAAALLADCAVFGAAFVSDEIAFGAALAPAAGGLLRGVSIVIAIGALPAVATRASLAGADGSGAGTIDGALVEVEEGRGGGVMLPAGGAAGGTR